MISAPFAAKACPASAKNERGGIRYAIPPYVLDLIADRSSIRFRRASRKDLSWVFMGGI